MTDRPPLRLPARPGLYDDCRIRMHYASLFGELDRYGVSGVLTSPIRRWYRRVLDQLIDGTMDRVDLRTAIQDFITELRADGGMDKRAIDYTAERLDVMRDEVVEYIDQLDEGGNG